ncbi:MAG: hypothetical protein J6Q17_08745 [Clostridia bacterium]|nr:hypothetical protein [Clostridia bacterium]
MTMNGAGENTLLALLWPLVPDDMTEDQREAFAAAVEAQTRFSESAAGRRTGSVASEAVGDVRVTYRQGSASDGYAVRGDTVSPEAAAILTRAGLLTRWV